MASGSPTGGRGRRAMEFTAAGVLLVLVVLAATATLSWGFQMPPAMPPSKPLRQSRLLAAATVPASGLEVMAGGGGGGGNGGFSGNGGNGGGGGGGDFFAWRGGGGDSGDGGGGGGGFGGEGWDWRVLAGMG